MIGRVVVAADRWLLAPAPAERLAMIRVLVGAFATVWVVASVGEFQRLDGRSAKQFEPVGIAGWFGGPLPSPVLWSLFIALVIACVLFTAGRWFHVAGPVVAIGFIFWASYHASWGQMLHYEHVLSLHLLVLGFSPAADALGWRQSSERRSPATRYGWPVRLMAMVTVVTYVLAGVAKIRIGGTAWFDGSTLVNHIAYSATRLDLLGEPRPPLASFFVGQAWLARPLAIASVAVELLAPLALLGGWFRRLWVPAVFGFHLATLTAMVVFFPFNGLGFALLPLYRTECLATVRSRRRRHSTSNGNDSPERQTGRRSARGPTAGS